MVKELDQIKSLIKARYPIIYIVSWEEFRVIKQLKENLEESKNLYFWSVTRGLRNSENLNEIGSYNEPIQLLNYIQQTRDNGLFILSDFHAFLIQPTPLILRLLHELSEDLKKSKKTIIIISPTLVMPKDLEKEITIIDFPLPNQEEIKNIFNRIRNEIIDQRRLEISIKEDKNEQIIKALVGLTQNEIENVLYKSLIETRDFTVDIIIKEKEQIIRKTGILEYFHSTESFEHIGGLDNLKNWIVKRKYAFKDKAREFGLPYPKGLLLLGVQGCGKSLCCKVIAKIWNFPLLRLDIGAIFNKYVGTSESNIRKVIKLAESIAPCILWVDEVEKGFSGVGSSGKSDSGTTARVFGTFLTWMQEKQAPVFIVATANDISLLPPEFLRKGRFDEIFFIDLPSAEERKEIFKIHLKKRNRDPKLFDINTLINKSQGFSGAEIESAIISALYDAFEENITQKNRDLETQHILNNLEITVPLVVTLEEKIRKMRKWAMKRARLASKGKPIIKENNKLVV